MRGIGSSVAYALANAVHPKMLWLMLWPLLIAALLWGAVSFLFWAQFVLWLAGVLRAWIAHATFFITWDTSDAALFAAKVVTLIMLVPLIQLTALLILGVFGMPAMVEHVAGRRFPELARRRGGNMAGSVWNSAVSLAGLAVLGVVSLPLWILPPLWPVIPVAIMGWVNQRVLRYDALSEHADRDEMESIFRERGVTLYLLGVVLALIAYIPLIGFFGPVLFGLTFIHYLLWALKEMREAPIEGRVLPP